MGQAKNRGTFEQRKAESISRREAEYKARPVTPKRRINSNLAAMLAIISGSFTGGRYGR
jgi:hypothetical protein